MNEINIREIRTEDYNDIYLLNQELNPKLYQFSAERIKQRIEYIINNTKDMVFVSVHNDEVIGYIHGSPYELLFSDSLINLLGFVVKEKYRNKGVGSMLISYLEDWEKGDCMKKAILIGMMLFTLVLTSCVKSNDKNIEPKKNNDNMEETIINGEENYLSYIDANDNLIYFKYSNLSENLKGIKVWVERYDRNEKNEYNAVEIYVGGDNVSIARDGNIKCKYKILSDNNVEIDVSIPSSSTTIKSYVDLSKYKEKVIINRDEIKVDNNVFILAVYILNDEKISIQDEIDNFESSIEKIIEQNTIVFVFKGCFFE